MLVHIVTMRLIAGWPRRRNGLSNINIVSYIGYHFKYKLYNNQIYQISDIIKHQVYQIQVTLSHIRYIKYHYSIVYRIRSNINYIKYRISYQISDIISRIRHIKYRILYKNQIYQISDIIKYQVYQIQDTLSNTSYHITYHYRIIYRI